MKYNQRRETVRVKCNECPTDLGEHEIGITKAHGLVNFKHFPEDGWASSGSFDKDNLVFWCSGCVSKLHSNRKKILGRLLI